MTLIRLHSTSGCHLRQLCGSSTSDCGHSKRIDAAWQGHSHCCGRPARRVDCAVAHGWRAIAVHRHCDEKPGRRHASASPCADWARPRAMPSTDSTWPTMATRVTSLGRRRARADQGLGRAARTRAGLHVATADRGSLPDDRDRAKETPDRAGGRVAETLTFQEVSTAQPTTCAPPTWRDAW